MYNLSEEIIRLEDVIERGTSDIANALLRIRDGRLYAPTYSTFEEYIRERWGRSRSWAYKRIREFFTNTALTRNNIYAEEPAPPALPPASHAGAAGREADQHGPRSVNHFTNARAGIIKTRSFAAWEQMRAEQRDEIFAQMREAVEVWPAEVLDYVEMLVRAHREALRVGPPIDVEASTAAAVAASNAGAAPPPPDAPKEAR